MTPNLGEKVKELNKVIDHLIEKALNPPKTKAQYQRYWKVQNPEFKKLDKELKILKNKAINPTMEMDSRECEKLVNEIHEAEMIRRELEKDVMVISN